MKINIFRNTKTLYQVLHAIKLSNKQKQQLISKRFQKVLIESYNHVPYYRKLMKNIGYNPLIDYTGTEDLRIFPITTKLDLKTHGLSSFLKENINTKNLFTDSTSGSTGIPIKVYRNWDERAYQIAKWLRVLFMSGYSVKEKVLSLTSPDRLYADNSILKKFGILRRIAVNYLLPANQVVDIILNYRPQILYGNRSHIDAVALEFLKRNIKPKGLKLIVVGAEIVHDSSRNLCKQAFGLDLIEFYGSAEMGIMAFEIQNKKGLHLCDDLTWFEFLDKNGNPVSSGEPGRVIVTDLIGKTMPFIRYDQGDFAITDTIIDSKGAPEKIISKVLGRDDDRIILSDGTTRPFHDFYEIMDRFNEIMQFRIIQKTKSYFQIKVVTEENYFKEIYNQIMDLLYIKFPKCCKFELLRVDLIEPDPNGKLRMLISELKEMIVQ